MPSLKEQIKHEQTEALKNREEEKLSVLRFLNSAIKNTEIEKHKELSDVEVQEVIARQVKQFQDALKDFERGGRADLAEKANREINLLKNYLPAQLSAEEIETAVKKILSDNSLIGSKEVGKAVGMAMKELKGKADGALVKQAVEKILAA